MSSDEAKRIAADFLIGKGIEFVPAGRITNESDGCSEVTFLVADALDPNVVVDPPDVRVLVNHESGRCELILQM